MSHFLKISLLLILIPMMLLGAALTHEKLARLSPQLQALLVEQTPELSPLTDNHHAKVHSVELADGRTVYPITIRTNNPEALKQAGFRLNSIHENWATMRVSADELLELAQSNGVSSIFQGDMLYPHDDQAVAHSGAGLVQSGYLDNNVYDGSGVIVLIIDTGIDWSHLDFRDPSDDTQSRILYIWDQTLSKTGGEQTPEDRDGTNFSGLDYGVEYTQTHIEDEIDGSAANFVRSDDTNGHGTSIAGNAAGNGASLSSGLYKSMAPGADIIMVKAGTNSFSDSNVKDALTYAEKIADTEGKAVVVNLSLGSQSNAHDGTSTLAEAVDDFVASGNGRVAVVSAGNEGNDAIHVTGSVNASGTGTVTITVPSFSNTSGASNDYFSMELWWNNNDDISATVTSPNAITYTRTAGQTGTSSTADGTIQLFNNTDSDHSNGDRRTFFQVYDGTDGVGPAIGDWTLDLTNNSSATMTYHAWLFASSMSATVDGGDSTYTISSPGTAASAITVGAYTARWRWYSTSGGANFSGPDLSDDIAYFSSIGPTRTGAQKPDFLAAGRGLYSATSTDYSPASAKEIVADKYHLTEGTSGAAGIVTGAVALMLDYKASLSAATIKAHLQNEANSDTYTGAVPNSEWGYGKLNVFESLSKAIAADATVNHDVYAYDSWDGNGYATRSAGYKDAVRFTPSTGGDVTGVYFHTYTTVPSSGSFGIEVWSDNGSNLPDSKLGSTVSLSAADVGKYTWNYVSLVDAGVTVTASTNYHLVIDNTTGSSYTLIAGNTNIAQRSSRDLGAGWGGPYTTVDWRIRPVVSTNEETLDSALPVELIFFRAGTERGQLTLSWATASETDNLGFRISRRIKGESDWTLLGDFQTHSELMGGGSSSERRNYGFVDSKAKVGVAYDYRLEDVSYMGLSRSLAITLEDVQLLLGAFRLYTNYPNPFNPSTTLAYSLGDVQDVSIRIFDIGGREVRSWNLAQQEAGYHELEWDGTASTGQNQASGLYLLSVTAGPHTESRKMLLTR